MEQQIVNLDSECILDQGGRLRSNTFDIDDMDKRMNQLQISKRNPIQHPIESVPKCPDCAKSEDYFQFECSKCQAIISQDGTTVGQLFAIIRQWNHITQKNIKTLILSCLEKGAHPDDRDAMTDMTMLHYVCKSGAPGMGNVDTALDMAEYLIEKLGANPNLCSRWNDMTALHIATYYDVAPLVGYLVTIVDSKVIDLPCPSMDSKTPLHIAASNLAFESAKVLLGAGANVLLKDQQDRTPLDCVPDDELMEPLFIVDKNRKYQDALELRALLEESTLMLSGEQSTTDMETLKTAKVVLSALGYEIGDRVVVGNAKVGILRYCGPTQFSSGIWSGVELDEPIGKNDGSIDGIQYFVCPPNHGIFAPLNRISKLDCDEYELMEPSYSCKQYSQMNGKWNHSYSSIGIDMTTIHSKVDTGLNRNSCSSDASAIFSSSSSVNSEDVKIGRKVVLTNKKTGIVRFIGMTKFSSGIWYGIELNRPVGKNDGSVQGVRYFKCPDQCGIFVQFPRISRLLSETRKTNSPSVITPDAFESDDTSSDMSMPISGTSSLDISVRQPTKTTTNGNDRLSSARNPFNCSMMVASTTNLQSSTFKRNTGLRRSVSITRSTSKTLLGTNKKDENQTWLRVGVNVLVNGMVASLRYIGPVHFTDGVFLGVELRTPHGKNDGTIDGVQYFVAKPNHGLLVRPQKVSVRGINASKLLPDEMKSKEI